eukprot:CAMPEP_0117581402 /NCGR_PEP_ID=MMETSP0784-20121206/65804_1 /TAXON_ID=39447 /ORGANISM="" /LENGTH=140 /DNA_ID=CAMNT_0005381703 /DNA_START=91 /DNA_END=510 /DNA_ORIENTATION=+
MAVLSLSVVWIVAVGSPVLRASALDHPAFVEPPTLRSPVHLTVDAMIIGDPRRSTYNYQWYTRAYGSEYPSPVHAPSVPGPTIRTRPGEQLVVRVRNKLGTEGEQDRFISPCTSQFCDLNTTNLHAHGLHVSPRCGKGED